MFTNNNHKLSLKNDARRPTSAASAVNSEYQRQSNYFPGGMDSSNTETMLISQNTNDGEFAGVLPVMSGVILMAIAPL